MNAQVSKSERHAFRQVSIRPAPSHFERFYRATLRWSPGARLRSLEVKREYDKWAAANGAPVMHERAIKRAMLSVGHTHFRSSNCYFGHAQLAADAPDLPDNFPASAPIVQANPALLVRIDQIEDELRHVRRRVEAALRRLRQEATESTQVDRRGS